MSIFVDSILSDLAEKIKLARINQGITQFELANIIGMSVTAVKAAEKGECKLSTFIKIIVALKLDSKLDLFLPRVLPSPILMEKANSKHRKRASKKDRKSDSKGELGW